MMPFSVRMAWRETRAAWRHFLYFFLCVALGVGTVVGVALFAVNLEETISRQARALMGGDLEVRLSRPMSERGELVLKSLAGRGITMTHASELVAMAAAEGAGPGQTTQIVELKAVELNYPLYGALELDPPGFLEDRLRPGGRSCAPLSGSPLTQALSPEGRGVGQGRPCFGALVQESLLIRMGLSLGERVKIGQATFIITGLIRKEPDRMATAFSLGPRVMIAREALAAAELIQPGSRVRERYLMRLAPTVVPHALLYELRGRFSAEGARISTYRNAQPRLKRFLDQLTRYLGLVGLTALFVGGIGVATTVQAFIREKLHSIAILKTLGAESTTVVRTYVIQAMLLGLMGSVAGAVLGLGLQAWLPSLMTGLFAEDLLAQIEFTGALTLSSFVPIVKGMALGLLTTLLFTVWPLLSLREIRPALILRRQVIPNFTTPLSEQAAGTVGWRRRLGLDDRLRIVSAVGIAGGLAGLAVWQAGSWTVGLLFIGALLAAVALLSAGALLLIRLLRHVPAVRSLAIRQAVRNVHRPGGQAGGIMVSIGIGVMVIVAVSVIERSLIREIGQSRPTEAPTFFFIDIQPDQKDAFVRLIEERTGGRKPEVTPLVRSRLRALDGRPVVADEESEQATNLKREGRKRWYFTRNYVLTFFRDLPKDNLVTRGTWWEPGEIPRHPLVSIEEEAARNLGVDLGSLIEFDIQGAAVVAEVSSIRRVDWGNFSTNFYMILSPGSLDGAPYTYVGTVRVPPEEEVPLQRAIVVALPNVTAINIGDVLHSFARILDQLSLAIRSIAAFCMLAGALVMAAALAATKYRRLYESVVLKAVGATRGLIARSFAVEYAVLGAAAGLIGIVLASGLSWGVLYFFLDVPWTLQPRILLTGLALTVLLALIVGFLSTFRILGQRPLSVLRHE